MNVMIGIDPHKASHTAVARDGDEDQFSSVKVRATRRQVDQLMSWAEPFEKRIWAIESAGGLGYLLAQQLVAQGEDVLDVPATLASRIRMLATNRSNKNDPNDAHSIAVAALRAPMLRSVQRTVVKSCASWPSATWTLVIIEPGLSVASTPSWPNVHRGELPRK
jgi:transposase